MDIVGGPGAERDRDVVARVVALWLLGVAATMFFGNLIGGLSANIAPPGPQGLSTSRQRLFLATQGASEISAFLLVAAAFLQRMAPVNEWRWAGLARVCTAALGLFVAAAAAVEMINEITWRARGGASFATRVVNIASHGSIVTLAVLAAWLALGDLQSSRFRRS